MTRKRFIKLLMSQGVPVSYTHLDVYKRQAVCIAGIALLAVVHHLLSKKRKSPRGEATPTKGNRKYIHKKYSR